MRKATRFGRRVGVGVTATVRFLLVWAVRVVVAEGLARVARWLRSLLASGRSS